MNKLMKTFIIMVLMVIICSFALPIFAKNTDLKKGDIKTGKDGWITWEPEAYDKSAASGRVAKTSDAVLSVVQVVAMGTAIIMLIVLGIKYISAAPSDKADIKKSAVAYVVGAIVLFAVTGILGVIQQFAVVITGK